MSEDILESENEDQSRKIFGLKITGIPKSKKPKKSSKKKIVFVAGGTPFVNLLPVEILNKRESGIAKKRSLRLIALGLVFIILGTMATLVFSIMRDQELEGIYNDVKAVTMEQSKYRDIVTLQNDISTLQTAREAVTVGEIDWGSFIGSLNSALPGNMDISSISIIKEKTKKVDTKNKNTTKPTIAPGTTNTTNPTGSVASTDITFSVEFTLNDLDLLSTFKKNMSSLKGFKSILFSTASQGSDQGYTVTSTIIFTKDLLWNRYSTTTTKGSE